MGSKKVKKMRKLFEQETNTKVLGEADRQVSAVTSKYEYMTNDRSEQILARVEKQTMVNMTKKDYRRFKKDLKSAENK